MVSWVRSGTAGRESRTDARLLPDPPSPPAPLPPAPQRQTRPCLPERARSPRRVSQPPRPPVESHPQTLLRTKIKREVWQRPHPPPLPLKIEAASQWGVVWASGRGRGSVQHQHVLGAWQAARWRRGGLRGPRRDPRQTQDRAGCKHVSIFSNRQSFSSETRVC